MTVVREDPINVLIAGIGGASLGLEIYKALVHAGGYRLVGTDRSPAAYGHGEPGFARTEVIDAADERAYVEALLDICAEERIEAVAPGAGATHDLLDRFRGEFEAAGILPMLNARSVVDLCADKVRTIEVLRQAGHPAPEVAELEGGDDGASFDRFPCVVKPRHDSGASNLVFLAEDREELDFFVAYLRRRHVVPVVQEYVSSSVEVSIGVLSAPDGEVLACTVLERSLEQKLSVIQRYGDRVLSSGWSQGRVREWPEVERQASDMARSVGSVWALNVQGRVTSEGVLLPFELNPRHSGTTYFRALSGRNEPDLLLQRCLRGKQGSPGPLVPGTYARAFAEKRVADGASDAP